MFQSGFGNSAMSDFFRLAPDNGLIADTALGRFGVNLLVHSE